MWKWIVIAAILLMIISLILKNKKPQTTLSEDIQKSYNWISEALKSSNYKADFSIESLKEVERLFKENCEDGKAKPDSLLSENLGQRLFGIGCYVGEVIRRHYGGEWISDDKDPQGEINIQVKLNDGTIIWPVQRVMKRFKNGEEDNIYVYGIALKPEKE